MSRNCYLHLVRHHTLYFFCTFSFYLFLITLSSQYVQGASSGSDPDDDSPLQIIPQDRDLSLRIGENKSFQLISTSSFPDVFGNTTNQTWLVFQYSVNPVHQIQQLPNVSLAPSFDNQTVLTIAAEKAGRLIVTSRILPKLENSNYTAEDIFLRISIYKLAVLNIICDVVGWIYFVAWSFSFYPQIIQNFQRKSVRGLSFEFVFLNITGFTVYSMYNIGLFTIKSIQEEYYDEDPTGSIPVQINDVIFSIHALFATSVTGVQCLIYDRGSQNLSYTGRSIILGITMFIFIMLVTATSNAITWLTFLNACSYVKLFITLIKYAPQAYLNYTRKSTSGWSIGNVLLDFTGGAFSMLQMLLIAYNHDDWFSILGDFTKFGLGLFSISFDVLFIIQHYVLYRRHREYEPLEGNPDPVMNPHEDMTTSNHIHSSYDENDVPRSSSIDSLRQNLHDRSEEVEEE